jgi:hypothetical protein
VTLSCSSPATYNTSNANSCGSWRWGVKTGQDSAAGSVSLTAVPTTIAALAQMAVPSGLGTSTPRTAPAETTVWILRNVWAIETKLESDSDYHIPIQETQTGGATMEVEIPFPGSTSAPCDSNVGGTNNPFHCFHTHARAALEKVITPTGSYQPIGQYVTVVGPALFDMLHGSASAAPNGIEIHGILALCFGLNCDPTAN